MNKNFKHLVDVILTKDWKESGIDEGSVGKITAWLPKEETDLPGRVEGVLCIMWHHTFTEDSKMIDNLTNSGGVWYTNFAFDEGLQFLNEYAESVESEEEYEDLINRMGWHLEE